MKEVIYLRVSKTKVEGMTKNLPNLYQGEIPVKIEIEIKPEAFREPVIAKSIVIEDWREGMDIGDVDLKEPFITEKEADLIRKQRRATQVAQLRALGYKIEEPTA